MRSRASLRIFNIPRDGSPTLGFSPRAFPQSSSHVGAIVGGTVGGVAGVVVLGLIAFWYMRRRADRLHGAFEIEPAHDKHIRHSAIPGIEPFTLSAPTTPAQPSTRYNAVNENPSPTSPSHPLLLVPDHSHDANGGAAPPSYEEASSSSSGIPDTPRPPRDMKNRAHAVSTALQ